MIRMTSIHNPGIPAALQKLFDRFSSKTDEMEAKNRQLHADLGILNSKLAETKEELEKRQEELQIATDYLDALLGHISQGILFLDSEGTVVLYNDTAASIFGKKGECVLFRSFWESFPDEIFGFSVKKALEKLECPNTLFISWSPDDAAKYELEISPSFFSKHNKVEGLVIRIRNITEIRRLQATANRHDRLKEIGSMASKVAHEIRNPLGGIKGFASLLERDLKEQPKMQQMAKAIVEGADNLNDLVSNILDYSRPLNPHFEPVDLVQLAEEIQKNIKADPQFNPNIAIHIKSKSSQIIVPVDSHLFRAAILNLILNGIQAMPEGGSLDVIISEQKSDASIQICDTGIGIPEENLDKIWTPFFTTKDAGNGLGLAIVHKIIDAHHGTIDAVSQVGKGTKFIIKIPLKP